MIPRAVGFDCTLIYMSKRDLEKLQEQVNLLSPDERRQLLAYLSAAADGQSAPKADINAYRGSIKLTVDPLEYQADSRTDRI